MSPSRLALSLVAAGLIAGTSGCGFIPGVLAPQYQGGGDSDDDRDDRDGEENRKESKNDDDDDD
jgi:hypothetical protein